MKKIRRLVLCLDGTWNNRDDSTNILHHFSLAYECDKEERQIENGEEKVVVTQQRFYNPGVGTGPLDRITGGGFGLGLEDHVREAYNWLVQNYEDGDGPDKPADEIYIFGFSRGAYEARSLVGFISMCGLLRRGAPLTVSQLWSNYCLLGRAREERSSFWSRAFGQEQPDFSAITTLMWDPWLVKKNPQESEEDWQKRLAASQADLNAKLPGQRVKAPNPTEKLLMRWSRRVKITYLGVYDTVGAVGWDALAIPGLRSKLALHNNMRPTSIIQNCRHALAIDENRSSFERTPFTAYIGPETSKDESERLGVMGPDAPESADTKSYKMRGETWANILKEWTEKIEQRWFVGAHSNIGGGYPDNRLTRRPLEWLMEGASVITEKDKRGNITKRPGLISEKVPALLPLPDRTVKPRDSYAEFAPPLWELVFRAKRNYRVIDPSPELRANRDEDKKAKNEPIRAGFSLVNINEQIDDSVFHYWNGAENPSPNLVGYAVRKLAAAGHGHTSEKSCCLPSAHQPKSTLSQEQLTALTALAQSGKKLAAPWLEGGFLPHLALIWWATLAAAGLAVTDRLFRVWPGTPPACLLGVLAAVFALVDWRESRDNFLNATGHATPRRRALQDAIYWTRALGVFFFIFGAFGALFHLWHLGWSAGSFAMARSISWQRIEHWWCLPLGAIVGVVAGNAFNRTVGHRIKTILGSAVTALLILAAIPTVIYIARTVAYVILMALHRPQQTAIIESAPDATTGGLLLLLQLGFVYLLNASAWNATPMRTANLGSIIELQKPWTPNGIKDCLDRWCKMLGDHHDEKASECAMTGIVGQCLWRDIFGYIPVYTLVLGFGFWFGCVKLGWDEYLPVRNLWWIVPLTTLVTDYFEDLCHFHFLDRHQHGALPGRGLTFASRFCTMIKDIGVGIELCAALLAVAVASCTIGASPEDYGWRGLLALTISVITFVVIVGIFVWTRIYKIVHPDSGQQPSPGAVQK